MGFVRSNFAHTQQTGQKVRKKLFNWQGFICTEVTSYKINTIYYFTGNEEPTPGMSYIEFDINKHTTDLLGLYRYVAAKVHRHHFVGGWAGLEIPR